MPPKIHGPNSLGLKTTQLTGYVRLLMGSSFMNTNGFGDAAPSAEQTGVDRLQRTAMDAEDWRLPRVPEVLNAGPDGMPQLPDQLLDEPRRMGFLPMSRSAPAVPRIG